MTETLEILMGNVERDLNAACLSYGRLKGYLWGRAGTGYTKDSDLKSLALRRRI